MRCRNNCGAVTKTPARVESYRRWQLCKPCAIKEKLVEPPINGHITRVRMGKGIKWRRGQGHAHRIQVNGLKTNKWMNEREVLEMAVLGREEF